MDIYSRYRVYIYVYIFTYVYMVGVWEMYGR